MAVPLLILLLGAGLRFHALGRDVRFHPDEALFSTFAREAAVDGRWMLPGPLDKPPLSIYASALSMVMTGVTTDSGGVLQLDSRVGEFAARLPDALAGIALIAVVYALARSLYGSHNPGVPLAAALLTALSPYTVTFSATAFTDTFMLLFMTLALYYAARGQWGRSGLALALSVASKPQGIIFLLLALALGWARETLSRRGTARFALGLLIGLGSLLIWDMARSETSIFALGAANNAPHGLLVAPVDLLPRLGAWLGFGQYLLGPGPITGLLLVFGVVAALKHDSRTRIDRVLLAFVVLYAGLYWLTNVNLYDRYLLPLLPPLALLAGRGAVRLLRARNRRYVLFAGGIVCIGLCLGAWEAGTGAYPIGGGREEYAGIIELADYLNARPVATVVYDHWLGWELGYYLGQWTNKRLTYYPTPEALVHDALLLPEIGPRYLPAPLNANVTPWLAALERAGFGVTPVYSSANFRVYCLIPPRAADGAGAGSSSPGPAVVCGG